MKKIVLGGLVFGLLAGCGSEQQVQETEKPIQVQAANPAKTDAPKSEPQEKSLVETPKAKLVEVNPGPFEPPKPWDFLKDGRPANTYTLTHARDRKVCSTITQELNKPFNLEKLHGVPITSSDIGFWKLRYFHFGSDITVPWEKLVPSISRYSEYVTADLDHDGSMEYVIRRTMYDGSMYVSVDLIKFATTIFDKSTGKTKAQSYDEFRRKLLTSESRRIDTEDFFANNVDTLGATDLPKPLNGTNLFIGQFVEIIRTENQDYLILGGLYQRTSARKYILAPVRILKRDSRITPKYSEPQYTYRVVCELRQNYFDSVQPSTSIPEED